jgi:histidyl-tRNA synthetase
MAKPQPISGFPEWLPEQRIVELDILDRIRDRFELYGFAPLETRSVEAVETLLSKGETDKEIYALQRLAADAGADGGARLGLHFDLTVPFARYVVQHYNELAFPFKRYQIQRSWRGERPQEGRYREFYQADIDVIDRDSLSLHFDAELPALLYETLEALPIPRVTLRLNNRKVTEGYLRGTGVDDPVPLMRILDKLDKVGPAAVAEMLTGAGASEHQVHAALALVGLPRGSRGAIDRIRGLGVTHPMLDEGLEELGFVLEELAPLPADAVVADMSVVRGFDYYTGTVYEGTMEGHEDLGAVCSGGRYENLAAGARSALPGVGSSIGVTRMLARLFARDLLPVRRKTPTVVLVALPSEELRPRVASLVRALRERGIAAEAFHEPVKYDKQLRYADRKGIPYVWFPMDGRDEVRDMQSGDQVPASAGDWTPVSGP